MFELSYHGFYPYCEAKVLRSIVNRKCKLLKIKIFVLIFGFFWGLSSHARSLLNVELAERIQRSDGQELVLNGMGVRKKFFFNIYICGLYVSETTGEKPAIYDPAKAKRILMHFVYKSVDKNKLSDGWQEGFAANHSEQESQKLAKRLEQFNQVMETMQAGEQIVLDYYPAKGTVVSVKGQEKTVIEGGDFFNALLDVWLGDKPISSQLKAQLLGKS